MNEEKKYLFILFFISFVFFFARIWEPYLSGDALKYALIAKEPIFTKDWLNLSLCHEPYLKKPPSVLISKKERKKSIYSQDRFFLYKINNSAE